MSKRVPSTLNRAQVVSLTISSHTRTVLILRTGAVTKILPSNSELASLLILVRNICDLEPSGIEDCQRWHITDNFKHDYERASALADRLVNICQEHVPQFSVDLERTKRWFEEIVDECQSL